MWIVRLALRRPYTFVVAAMLVVILGVVFILRMPTDIFPEINIPVIAVAFNYGGMTPNDMEQRMVTNFEGFLVTTVNDIEHVESQSLNGIGVIKVYFYPNAKIEEAMSQVTSIAQTAVRSMPPGSTPPLIIKYNASDVPILQLALGSDTLSEQEVFDNGINFVRNGLVTVQGVEIPFPYGGRQRQVMVDLDPDRLYAWGISPSEVSAAINSQNLVLPAGTAKIGKQEYPIHLNASPTVVDALNELPIKTINGTTVYIKDVAHVRDGYSVQQSIVHANGKRGVLMVILKNGGASTIDVVQHVLDALPAVENTVPKSLKITPMFDQSVFVRASVDGVVREAIIAAGLTGLMILMFLGSWRSTLIVIISIPLSILVSIIIMYFMGETLNVMTLGGMALAVGILVDDATVAIENIHRNIGEHKPLLTAILDGSAQIAVPAFVSTLCICIVFVPVAFITGAAKFLFTPLALAVVFAMMTSYVLSRTLVPTLINYLLPAEMAMYDAQAKGAGTTKHGLMWRFHDAFNRQFEKLRRFYGGLLTAALEHRAVSLTAFTILVAISLCLFPFIGQDFFPTVDAGQIRLHVRAPPGTRIEETEQIFGHVENVIRQDIPASEIDTILDNMGIPNSSINLSLSDGSLMSPADGEVLVSLKPGHRPTEQFIDRINIDLHKKFPNEVFFFQPADIVTQVLNFGIPAPIDVQINGPAANADKNYQIALDLNRRIAAIPGAADVRVSQVPDTPDLHLAVDRTLASEIGVTESKVANDMLVSLSGTAAIAPNFWVDPHNGRQYNVLVQTPQYKMDSINDLQNSPVISTAQAGQPASTELLGNLTQLSRGVSASNITHYQLLPCFDVMAGVRGTDLASVAAQVRQIVASVEKSLPRGSTIAVRGQVQSMTSSFTALGFGLIFAVVLVYLLMVVNFQSWLDPMIILMALPGALAGIMWILFLTGTTISVPALMGAIMSIGVATANSILVITFANDQRQHNMNAHDAALAAGLTRLRPVLMTAAAMIIGMLPMALGLGEGGEQNAPLGRAVIGGLIMATFATLFFVPIVYSKLRQNAPITHVPEELM